VLVISQEQSDGTEDSGVRSCCGVKDNKMSELYVFIPDVDGS